MKTIYTAIFGRFSEEKAIERNMKRMSLGLTEQEFNARLARRRAGDALAWAMIVIGLAGMVFASLNYPG